jgi:hypothetical protein
MAEPRLPELEFRAPDCPLCGTETNPNDGAFDCESCNLTWESDGRNGRREDPSRPRCAATCMPHEEKLPDGTPRWKSLAGRRYECALDADHGDHIDHQSKQRIPHRGVYFIGGLNYPDTHEWDDADSLAATS